MGPKFFYRDIDLVYFVNNRLISNNLINQKDRVLLSFSGGQDSICLLFILNQLSSQLELDITFLWCHHLWQTDSFYLMQQMAKLSFLFQFNSCFAIPLNFISSELLARKWRQSCNYRVSLFYNYSKICLAHTFNDKVETIFLNFMRGTGLVGLSPLRWTQLISKDNITNEKHISQHNYLSSGASEPNEPNMCIPSMQGNKVFAMANSDKLKNLTKKVISKFINCSESDSADPLALHVYSSISYPFTPSGYAKLNFVRVISQILLLTKGYPLPVTDSASASLPLTGYTYALLRAHSFHPSTVSLLCTYSRGKKVEASLVKGKSQYQLLLLRKPVRGMPSIHIASQTRTKFSFAKGLALPSWQKGEMNVGKLLLRKPVRALLPRFFCSFTPSGVCPGGITLISPCRTSKFLPFRGTFTNKQSRSCLASLTEEVSSWQSQEKAPCFFCSASPLGVCPTGYSFATRYPFTPWVHKLEAERYSCASKELKASCYIARPLLFISRIELNKICYFWELPIYPDKSNQKVKFLRNRVRRQLLPTIKLFFNSNIENIFLQLAKIVETEDYCLTTIMNKFTQNY